MCAQFRHYRLWYFFYVAFVCQLRDLTGQNLLQVSFRCCTLCGIFLSHLQKYNMWQKADKRWRSKLDSKTLSAEAEKSEAARRAIELTAHSHVDTSAVGSLHPILEVRFREQFIRRYNERVPMSCMP